MKIIAVKDTTFAERKPQKIVIVLLVFVMVVVAAATPVAEIIKVVVVRVYIR